MGNVWERGKTERGKIRRNRTRNRSATCKEWAGGGSRGSDGKWWGFLGKGIQLQIHRELHIGNCFRLEARYQPSCGDRGSRGEVLYVVKGWRKLIKEKGRVGILGSGESYR